MQPDGRSADSQQTAAVTLSPQQQTAMAQQTQQFQQRAASLDKDNQELESLLAQSRQQMQLLQDQIAATQTQLRDTTNRLAAVQSDNDPAPIPTTPLVATSTQRPADDSREQQAAAKSRRSPTCRASKSARTATSFASSFPADQLFNPAPHNSDGADATLVHTFAADLGRTIPSS